MGRPKKDVLLTEEQIRYFASIGCTDEEIAEAAGLTRSTLQRRFGAALKEGRASLRTKLRKAQIAAALNGNVTMLIWLGKQYLGQRDRHDLVTLGRDITNLSDDELRQIIQS